jgi:trk system potassium uptake protein TrkA
MPEKTAKSKPPFRIRRKRGGKEFLVIGLGRFGAGLARTLLAAGHEVLAVDKDFAMVELRAPEIPHAVQLDSTKIEALREIGAEHFDIAIVCIGSDFEANLLTTVSLKKLGVPQIIAKARTRTQKEILLQVGAEEVILPEHEAGVRLGRRLSGMGFINYLEVSEDFSIVEMLAPERYFGHTLAEANLRQKYGLTVIAIRRGEEMIVNPPADFRIEDGDEFIVVGAMTDAERMTG